jgi:hypothetical protein
LFPVLDGVCNPVRNVLSVVSGNPLSSIPETTDKNEKPTMFSFAGRGASRHAFPRSAWERETGALVPTLRAHRYTQVSWKLFGKITGIYYGFLTVHRCSKIRFFGKIGFLTMHRRSKIRFFGKIGFLTVHRRPKIRFFWKNRIFNRASALKNPIFWKNRIFNRGNACTDAPRPATSKVCKTRPRPYSS